MNTTSQKEQQQRKIRTQPGFLAALDQSGGSTPNALAAYGIARDAYSTDEEMFDLMATMRSRIASKGKRDSIRMILGGMQIHVIALDDLRWFEQWKESWYTDRP